VAVTGPSGPLPPSRWSLPDPAAAEGELVAVGADLEPGTLLAAYREGLFPMRLEEGGPIGWWSPDPRGIVPLEEWRPNRSLRRARRGYDITVDTAFVSVVRGCADPARPHGWIDEEFVAAYTRLHTLGWAHSVEVWGQPGGGVPILAGGLYGIAIGGLFAGESMFHRARDASKAALGALIEALRAGGGTLFDVQWRTPHLASLGTIEVPRRDYLARLAEAVERPQLTLG
jgi:leucyl/phenylalanyl-tRNA--protein transferase